MGESEMWLTCTGEKYSVCILGEERCKGSRYFRGVEPDFFWSDTHLSK
jgi:hypothetical protein